MEDDDDDEFVTGEGEGEARAPPPPVFTAAEPGEEPPEEPEQPPDFIPVQQAAPPAARGRAPAAPAPAAEGPPEFIPLEDVMRQQQKPGPEEPPPYILMKDTESNREATPGGVFAREAAQSVVPGAAGLAAGSLAWPLVAKGAAVGTGIGGPVGGVVGGGLGFLASLGIGTLAGTAARYAQDAILEKAGIVDPVQAETDRIIHPYIKEAGTIAGMGPFLRPSMSIPQTLLGGGAGGAISAGHQYLTEDHVDPYKVGMGVVGGALFNQPYAHGVNRALRVAPAETPTTPGREGPLGLPEPPIYGRPPEFYGGPEGGPPRLGGPPAQRRITGPIEGEIMPPDPNARTGLPTAERLGQDLARDAQFAAEQRARYTEGDPLHKFWDDHFRIAEEKYNDFTSRWGPPTIDGDYSVVTPGELRRANYQPSTGPGEATVNPPAPRIAGAGNPVGAPMNERLPARPSSPLRDYRKLAEPVEGERTGTTTGPRPDVVAALRPDDAPRGLPAPEAPPTRGLPAPEAAPARGLPALEAAPAPRAEPVPGGPLRREVAPQHMPAYEAGFRNQRLPRGFNDAEQAAWDRGANDRMNFDRGQERPVTKPAARPAGPSWIDELVARAEAEPTAPRSRLAELGQRLRGRNEPFNTIRPGTREVVPEPARGVSLAEQRVPVAPDRARGAQALARSAERLREQGLLPQTPKRSRGERVVMPERKDIGPPLTDNEHIRSIELYQSLKDDGAQYMADRIATLPPRKRLEAFEMARTEWDKHLEQTGQAARTEKSHAKNVTPEGAKTASTKDAARKVGAIKAATAAAEKYGRPVEGETPAERMSRLTTMVKHFDELSPGYQYKNMHNQPPDFQLVRRARSMIQNPNKKNRDEFTKAEVAFVNADRELARMNQKGTNIDADIKKRPTLDAAREEAPVDLSRSRHEYVDPNRFRWAPESMRGELKQQSDASVDFLNRLKDTPWHYLNDVNDGQLDLMVRTTRHPERLVEALKDQLLDKYLGEKAMPKDKQGFWSTLLADENGSMAIPKVTVKMPSWAKKFSRDRFKSPFHSYADPATVDYANQISGWGVKLNTTLSKFSRMVTDHVDKAGKKYADGTDITEKDFGQMFRAWEKDKLNTLSPKQRKYWDTYEKPLLDRINTVYKELKDISVKLQLPGYKEMTDIVKGHTNYIPRILKEADTVDQHGMNVITGEMEKQWTGNRSLSNFAGAAQTRDWMVLQGSKGEREVIHINDNGDVVIWRNGQTTHSSGAPNVIRQADLPEGFNPAQVGHKIKTKTREWTVDHATIDELVQHGRGKYGEKLEFHDNPLYTTANALIGLRAALERARTLEKIIEHPAWEKQAFSSKEAVEKVWGKDNAVELEVPQLKGKWLPKPSAWALNDLIKQGFNYEKAGRIGPFLNAMARFSQATLRPFYIMGPQVHVWNELDKLMNLFPEIAAQSHKMPQFLKESYHSVLKGDATQAEILKAGGNLMYMHSYATRAAPRIGKALGVDARLRPWRYDPLAKAFNVNVRDIISVVERKTNNWMWAQTDMLYTTVYKAFREQGLNPEQAVHRTENIIDSYVLPPTVGKTIGAEWSDFGRGIQQFIADPAFTNFGRYRLGVAKSLARIAKNLLGPDSTYAQRATGAAQVLMLTAVMPMMYHGLSAGWQSAAKMMGVPNAEKAEVETRGISRPVEIVKNAVMREKGKGISDVRGQIHFPSNAITFGQEAWQNRDFAGRRIIDTSGGWSKVPGQAAEYALGVFASPAKDISKSAVDRNVGDSIGDRAKWMGHRFLESNFGMRTPTPAAVNFEVKRAQYERQQARARERAPRGALEKMWNSLFK